MNKDTLLQYFDRHYIPRRDMLPRIPLGTNPDEFWKEIESRRRARSTTLPIHGPAGSPYWFVTTDRMVSASETIVEELMANDESTFHGPPVLAPLEEVFYTSYPAGALPGCRPYGVDGHARAGGPTGSDVEQRYHRFPFRLW